MFPISFLINDGDSVARAASERVVVTTIHLQSSRSQIKLTENRHKKLWDLTYVEVTTEVKFIVKIEEYHRSIWII